MVGWRPSLDLAVVILELLSPQSTRIYIYHSIFYIIFSILYEIEDSLSGNTLQNIEQNNKAKKTSETKGSKTTNNNVMLAPDVRKRNVQQMVDFPETYFKSGWLVFRGYILFISIIPP